MSFVQLTGVKGEAIWVNAHWVMFVAAHGPGAGGSMYGDNNVRSSTKVQFVQEATVEVKETVADVISRLATGGD